MRVSFFTHNLEAAASREDVLRAQITRLVGTPVDEILFVGYRRLGPSMDDELHVPYERTSSTSMKIARGLFRVVDKFPMMPVAAARFALAVAESRIIEALLACDPDAIVLDVRWNRLLQKSLEGHFSGDIFALNDQSPRHNGRAKREWRKTDPGATVSIVLPTYNGSRYLRESLESCLNQTFRNLELIVVDDGSAEDIQAIVSGMHDPRVTYVRHDVNRGLPEALNTGFRAARGDYLTWTSDDNRYAADAIERLVGFLASYPAVDFVYASSFVLDEMGLGKPERVQTVKPPEFLVEANGVGACFLYRRNVYRQIGDYDRNVFLAEDFDYWIRVSKQFRMQRLFAPLYYYRFHKKALTFAQSREAITNRTQQVKRQHGLA
jgi:hypothetical protein